MAILPTTVLLTLLAFTLPTHATSASNTTQSAIVNTAFQKCGTTVRECNTLNTIDSCLTKAVPDFWNIYDTYAPNAATKPIKDTPLGAALQKVKHCVCEKDILQKVETCVKCIRKEGGFQNTEVLEVYDLSVIIGEACSVKLEAFSGKKEDTKWTATIGSATTTGRTTSTRNGTVTSTTMTRTGNSTTTTTATGNLSTTATPTLSTTTVFTTLTTPTPSGTNSPSNGDDDNGAANIVGYNAFPVALAAAVMAGLVVLL